MRSVAEHLAATLALAPTPRVETVPIARGLGRVLAEPVSSAVDLPGFTNSAMDGYAVRAVDVAAAPVTLPVDGDLAAGHCRPVELRAGRAWRIMTGAPLPAGADAVVPVELTDAGAESVTVREATRSGAHIRRVGEDLRQGQLLLSAGTRLAPGQIGLLAAGNRGELRVVARPRVAVVATGDELRPAGTDLQPGQICDSNSPMLAALVHSAGAELTTVVQLPDDAALMAQALAEIAQSADLVLTTGGVSMGVYDTVKAVLSSSGTVDFVRVAMRPGMPQGLGRLGPGGTPVLTLPGNPVSALVSFHVFALPLIRAMLRLTSPPTATGLVAGSGWSSPEDKAEYSRVVVRGGQIQLTGGQGSHMLSAMAQANALAVVPVGVGRVEPGDRLDVIPLMGMEQS